MAKKCIDCVYSYSFYPAGMWPTPDIDPTFGAPPRIKDAVEVVCYITFGGFVPLCEDHIKDAEEEWGESLGQTVPRKPLEQGE